MGKRGGSGDGLDAAKLWQEYVAWLKRHAPAAHQNLAAPASAKDIAEVERVIGSPLPLAVKAVWALNNGQKKTMHASSAGYAMPCLPSLSFLSTKLTIKIWRDWASLRKDEASLAGLQECGESFEPGVVQPLYTHAGWIPLWSDATRADFIGIDLAPGPQGTVGQVINFGRDEERHFSPASSFEGLLAILLDEVKSGKWPLSEGHDGKPWFGDPEKHFFNALHARWKKKPKARATPQRDPAVLVREAASANADGKHARALPLLNKARAIGFENLGLLSWHEAEALEGVGRYAEAEAAYEAAGQSMGETGSAYMEKRANNLLVNLKRPAEAAAFLRRALGLLSKEAKGRSVFGRVFRLAGHVIGYHLGRFQESLPYLEIARKLEPMRAENHGAHAYALAALGKAAPALAATKQALDGEPGEALEYLFIAYAMSKPAKQPMLLAQLRQLVIDKQRAKGRKLEPIVAAATKLKHPQRAWLGKLAQVITAENKPAVLKAWPEWSAG